MDGPANVGAAEEPRKGDSPEEETILTGTPSIPQEDEGPHEAYGLLEGSKLILRLRQNDAFAFDAALRLMCASPGVIIESKQGWTSFARCNTTDATVILDAGGWGRFIPIPIRKCGTIYTRSPVSVVAVGAEIRRSTVRSRCLPFGTCYKFECPIMAVYESEANESSPRPRTANSSFFAGRSPMLVLRGDESVVRYALAEGESLDLASSRLLAWTLGVKFRFKTFLCFRFVVAVTGRGVVWLQSTRSRVSTPPF